MNRKKQAENVQDIFKMVGKENALNFLNRQIMPSGLKLDLSIQPVQAQSILEGIHYDLHKDLPDLAAVAVQRFNSR